MNNFFTVSAQTTLFGLVNIPFIILALFVGVIALVTRKHNHIYTWIIFTSFLALAFHLSQSLFVLVPLDAPVFPYLQFIRTALMILTGLSSLVTLYYIWIEN